MLELDSLHYSYGPARALSGISLTVASQEVVCLLGMNGAGKTTTLNLISGLYKPDQGSVILEGRPLTGLSPAQVVAAGVVQAPEGRQVFAPLSVAENLELGAYLRLKKGQRDQVAQARKRVLETFPVLGSRLGQAAGTLSGGEQQMLAMGRALMAAPRVLLLDEPSLGLAPLVAADIFRVVRGLPEAGCSVLLVEQNAMGALSVSARGYIITGGRIRSSGQTREILRDRHLREAFLGPERATTSQEAPPCP